MQLFYFEHIDEINQNFILENQEHTHLTKVLRKKEGDSIHLTNGKGTLFLAEILKIEKRRSVLIAREILKTDFSKNGLSIGIAPTKNISRMEWFIEKSVEIGIDEIFLIVSKNSERRNVKEDRLQLKSLSAMKQSLKLNMPKVSGIYKFEQFIQEKSDEFDLKLIAYCEEESISLEEKLEKKLKTLILIGPEGGFTKNEVDLTRKNDFTSVSLGTSRLRTETAGIYSCSVFNSMINKTKQ